MQLKPKAPAGAFIYYLDTLNRSLYCIEKPADVTLVWKVTLLLLTDDMPMDEA